MSSSSWDSIDSMSSIDSSDFSESSSSSDSDSDKYCSKDKRWVPFRKYGRCGKPRKSRSSLHSGCKHGKLQLVKDLITRGYNINKLNSSRVSPLVMACRYKHLEIFKFILRLHSFKITQIDIVDIVIADDVDFTRWWLVISQPTRINDEILDRVRQFDNPVGDLNLLTSYNQNREQTLNKIRQNLGMVEDLFSLVVLNTDHYLIRSRCVRSTARWFSILKQLPMELQMLICHRTYGSSKNNINSQLVEKSLKKVVGWYL